MPEEEIIHLNITITGQVQGVGFRYSAKNQAITIGIKGIIKNLENGDVYIEAESSKEKLHLFIDWCYRGPAHASVKNIAIVEDKICHYNYFEIIR